tara:strand:- start:1251 stop:1703 length:453 start_codon:yes stop_codon:yes gene_type:complete
MSNNSVSSKTYREKLSEYDTRFYLILEDFKNFYVQSKLNSDSSDAENAFYREKTMITDNQKNLFLLNNDVEKEIKNINLELKQLEKSLTKEKKNNKELSFQEESLESLSKASIQMLKDKNVSYNQRLITIFNLIIGTLASGFIIYKIPKV